MTQFGFLVDANNCIGCKTCEVACKDVNEYTLGCGFRAVKSYCTGAYPDVAMYHVSYIPAEAKKAPKTGEMKKCNYCAEIQAQGEQPVCVAACPMRAIEFGRIEEIISKHDGKKIATEFPAIDSLGETQTNHLYILKDCMHESDYDEVVL